ncbi:MAG: 1-acyl-sn-glycerol-3-phosphate acyltransferase [Clostridiales bacterium]|nr:1-acyl-sn-glycerol-3-phosphate acyltransferase [Clostridiales bacterium]
MPEKKTADDGHILHFPQPFRFEAGRNYDFLRRGALKTSWHNLFRRFAEIVLDPFERIFLGFAISGAENIDVFDSRGAVVVCNHVSALDCTFLEFAFPYKRTYFTTLESNFRIPVVRHLIRWLGAVPIPSKTSGLAAFTRAVTKAVEEGDCVIYYPEGILYPKYNGLRDFNEGAFRLACRTGVPVIPAVVTFRERRGIFGKRISPSLRVLPPMEPGSDCAALSAACRAAMEKAIAGINEKNGVGSDPYLFISGRDPLRHEK